jgi:hypothetical protein
MPDQPLWPTIKTINPHSERTTVMAAIPLRQTHSFRPIVRPILLDLLHFLSDVRSAFFGVGDSPARSSAFPEQIFERAVWFGPGPATISW